MQGSTPQTYTIADFLKWHDDGELQLNPKFQRGSVWSPSAKTYLIDSILRGYPIPKLLLRTKVDRDSRRTLRDVVDGQQRLRTIIEFSSGKLVLGNKAGEWQGYRYSDLDDETKDSFLSYKLTCEQLINADDDDVLEVFVRINSYAIPVSAAELRNAQYDTEFSDLVKTTVKDLPHLWELGVISERDRVRMVDQTLISESYAFLSRGVIDGAESDISRYYKETSHQKISELPSKVELETLINETVDLVAELHREPIVQRPHFLMLLASVMYAHGVLPEGKLNFNSVPNSELLLNNRQAAKDSVSVLNVALGSDQSERFTRFRDARSSTQRIKSRQTRFEYFCRALAGDFAE